MVPHLRNVRVENVHDAHGGWGATLLSADCMAQEGMAGKGGYIRQLISVSR